MHSFSFIRYSITSYSLSVQNEQAYANLWHAFIKLKSIFAVALTTYIQDRKTSSNNDLSIKFVVDTTFLKNTLTYMY